MAITYFIDPQARVVYLTVTGESFNQEWQETMRSVLSDTAYVRGFNFLTDRRGQENVPGPDFPRQVLRFLVAHVAEMGRYRWAAVSPREATFLTLHMFSILAEEVDIRVRAFKDYEEAKRWLLGEADAEA